MSGPELRNRSPARDEQVSSRSSPGQNPFRHLVRDHLALNPGNASRQSLIVVSGRERVKAALEMFLEAHHLGNAQDRALQIPLRVGSDPDFVAACNGHQLDQRIVAILAGIIIAVPAAVRPIHHQRRI